MNNELQAELAAEDEHINYLQSFKKEVDRLLNEATLRRVALVLTIGQQALEGEI